MLGYRTIKSSIYPNALQQRISNLKSDLDILKAVVKPPINPLGANVKWETVESRLGVGLPADYKAFISVFGTGSLQTFLHIWNFSDTRMSDPLKGIAKVFSQLEYYKKTGKPIEFTRFPEVGGLLPFASTDDGNYLFWRMEGEPDSWDVAAFDFTTGFILDAPGVNMVKCLLRLVQKDNPFGDRFCNIENFNPPCTFAPWQEA